MVQLSLFPVAAERPDSPAADLPSVDETLAKPDLPLDASASLQIGLFDARVRQLRVLRDAIALGHLDEAHDRLQSIASGEDLDANDMRDRLSKISAQLAHAG